MVATVVDYLSNMSLELFVRYVTRTNRLVTKLPPVGLRSGALERTLHGLPGEDISGDVDPHKFLRRESATHSLDFFGTNNVHDAQTEVRLSRMLTSHMRARREPRLAFRSELA